VLLTKYLYLSTLPSVCLQRVLPVIGEEMDEKFIELVHKCEELYKKCSDSAREKNCGDK